MDQAYENTERKIRKIQDSGYRLEVIWECEYDQLLKANPVISEYLDKHPVMSKIKIEPRDALSG